MLALREFARDASCMVGLVIVLATAVVALLAPHLAPHPLDAYESHPLQRLTVHVPDDVERARARMTKQPSEPDRQLERSGASACE